MKQRHTGDASDTTLPAAPELVCPAGSLRALQAAVGAGADAVYLGLKDATNARNFAGLNFDDEQVRERFRQVIESATEGQLDGAGRKYGPLQ